MQPSKTIPEELKELNSTLPPVKEPVFTVPNGYFENFADSVLSKIRNQKAVSVTDELAQLSPLLAGLSKKSPYTVPENYFSSLANDVPVLIGNDPLPSILAELNKAPLYEVPAGYFENFPQSVLAKVTNKSAKVISITPFRWMRMAAAAVVAGIIAISSFVYFNRKQNIDIAQQPEAWVAKNLQGVSDKALEEFVNSADVSGAGQVAQNKPSTEVRSLLGDVSDRELDAFLAQVPGDDDELLLIN